MKLEIKGNVSDIFLTALIGFACPLLLLLVIEEVVIEEEKDTDNDKS